MFSFSLSPSVRVWHACLHTAATLNGILSQRKDHHHHESSSIYFFISKVKDPFCCIPITIFYNPHSHKTTFCSTPFHIQNCYYVHFIRYQILIGVQHIHCLNNISIVLTYVVCVSYLSSMFSIGYMVHFLLIFSFSIGAAIC